MTLMDRDDPRRPRNRRRSLIGTTPSRMTGLLGTSGRIPVARSNVAGGIPAVLLLRSTDIRPAELAAATQSTQVGTAMADLYPQFILSVSIGLQASGGRGLFSSNSTTGPAR